MVSTWHVAPCHGYMAIHKFGFFADGRSEVWCAKVLLILQNGILKLRQYAQVKIPTCGPHHRFPCFGGHSAKIFIAQKINSLKLWLSYATFPTQLSAILAS
jgi:hypothetical protein